MQRDQGAHPKPFRRPVELVLYATAPAATLLTAPLLARGLGPVERGQYGLAIAVATLAMTVGSWGQGDVLLGMTRRGVAARYSHFQGVAAVGGVLSGVACFVMLLALGTGSGLAAATAITVPFLSITGLWQADAVRMGLLRPLALSNVVVSCSRVLGFTGLVLAGAMSAPTAAVVFQAALLAGLFVTVGLATRRARRHEPDSARLTMLLGAGALITAFNLANALLQRSDLIALQIGSSPAQLGLYAAPASLTTAALALSAAFKPRVQRLILQGEGPQALERELGRMLLIALVGVGALVVVAPVLVGVLFGEAFEGSIAPLRLLAMATIPVLTLDLVYGVLVASSRRAMLVGIATLGAALNALLLAWWVPPLGAEGAALAVLVAYSATGLVGVVLARRVLGRSSP